MNGLVATGRPARATDDIRRVIDSAMHDRRVAILRLKVALVAEAHVPRLEHFVVHRPMRRVARGAAFAHHFVFEHERSRLRGMTFGACCVH